MGDSGATYNDDLRLTGEHVVDFLSYFELILSGVKAEALGAIIFLKSAISLQQGPVVKI